jgi:hypothetical protein
MARRTNTATWEVEESVARPWPGYPGPTMTARGPRLRSAGATALMVAALVGGAGPGVAGAQSPSYGGGLLPYTVVPRGFNPSVGIALQPRGDRVALRFDTTLLCGGRTFEAVGRKLAAFDGSAIGARGASRVRGLGLRYAWTLSGVLSGRTVSGELRIAGTQRRDGRRFRCTRHPSRRFQARIGSPPAGAPAPARHAAVYDGMSELSIGGLPGPVVLRTSRDGRKVAARWNAIARCGRGPRERLVNFTPLTRIGAAGGFLRKERFKVRYTDAVVTYRVRFGGRFTTDGAGGRLRMRATVRDRHRRLVTRCDTGTRAWHALAEEPAAPAPRSGGPPAAGPGSPVPSPPASPDPPPRVSGGTWSLHMESEPGDYIGQGRTYDFSSPGDRISAGGSPDHLDFAVYASGSGSEYSAGFFAPQGQTLRAGVTYTDNAEYSATPSDAGMAMGAESRGCNTGIGSFTVEEIAFAADRTLQAAVVSWTFRCNTGAAAIRGSWSFHR